ncbi:MAG: M20/M25/M40 family metallo-hydrolase [Acidobacteria bacterium]|nr:M20/M25/M40 family metallo-hydrolase [Acidobacteriota bacterium]
MLALVLLAAFLLFSGPVPRAQTQSAWLEPYRTDATRLIAAATANQFAWDRLAELTDTYGNRLTGSANLTRAIAWAVETMKRDGLDAVRTEKVMGPQWVRGQERALIVDPPEHPLAMLGLGGSVATPAGGLEAEVMVVRDFQELTARAHEAKGKIVLFNVPYTTYGQTVAYRAGGAKAAAPHGAVAVLVRAVGPMGLRTPHTGGMQYEGATPIPAAAIAAEDANRLQRLVARGQRVRVRLEMQAHFAADVETANVIGEIGGRERPEEVVLVGGHFDSWDVGTGASDDGVGCIVTWEALRLMKTLGLKPRRTVRLVLFTNEENGLRGGTAYRDAYKGQAGQHVLAIESDSGVFAPARLGFTGSDAARALIQEIASLLAPLGLQQVGLGGGGADIGPIAQAGKVPMLAYQGDATKYFTIHHTPADTVDRIAPDEVAKAAAALAVITYVVAEMGETLPK